MSEKLMKCRMELSDAIDRALEGWLRPMSRHQHICQCSLLHTLQGSGPMESPPGSPAVPQQPLESRRLVPAEGPFADGVCSLRPLSSTEIVLRLCSAPPPEPRSQDFQPELPDAENLPRDLSPQDVTGDLLALIEDTSAPVLQEISRTPEWNSDICILEDDLPLTPHDTPPPGATAEPVPDDDQMAEMVLDLEEDYGRLKSCLIL